MKKLVIVLALAVALTFAMTATAFADHSPSFFIKWNATGGYEGANSAVPSPHAGYTEGTQKCAVCHAVHRAPVVGTSWTNGVKFPADGGDNAAVRATYLAASSTGNTQMLLMSDVAGSCAYCHISTSVGGQQLYAGKSQYITYSATVAGSDWDEGYGHHNGCTGCHAVHGASANYGGVPEYYGAYGTFQGPAKSVILKVRAKGAGGAGNQAYVWQDEVVRFGTSGALAANNAWGVDYSGIATAAVDPLNVPLFTSEANAVNGVNVRPGADAYDAQVSAFCTFCHQNYGYASEATVNPDGDRSLFQAGWYYNGLDMNTAAGNTAPFKNHPMKSADATFVASGATVPAGTRVAYAAADTCRSCHDAGVKNVTGVIFQSFPHFTPGYFKFTKTGDYMGDATPVYTPSGLPAAGYLAAGDPGIVTAQAWLEDPTNYEEAIKTSDGGCLKCHVNGTQTAGVGIGF